MAGEVGVGYKGLIDLVAGAVGAEVYGLGVAVVEVMGTDGESIGKVVDKAGGELQVHEFILMAQILIFGVVDGCVVDTDTDGETVGKPTAKGSYEGVGVAVLGALVGE